MQRLEVNGAVRPIYGSLGVKRLRSLVGECALNSCSSDQETVASSCEHGNEHFSCIDKDVP